MTITQPTDGDVAAFLATVPDERRRSDAEAVVELMQRVTGEQPVMWGGAIIGFGSYHYRYASGREGDTMVLGVSPRKAALTLYGVWNEHDPDERFDRLGSHTTGKGCLYLKRVDAVDAGVLEELIRDAWSRRA